jgi:hypothetical protein
MTRRRASSGLLAASICLIGLAISAGTGRVNSVMAAGFEPWPGFLPAGQILLTATPQIAEGGEALMTNPVLLQVMILLSLLTLIVIFWGVWINRHKADQ